MSNQNTIFFHKSLQKGDREFATEQLNGTGITITTNKGSTATFVICNFWVDASIISTSLRQAKVGFFTCPKADIPEKIKADPAIKPIMRNDPASFKKFLALADSDLNRI